ncbi:MAG: hypothetical protein QM811_31635 [Pirellulales bacterium]
MLIVNFDAVVAVTVNGPVLSKSHWIPAAVMPLAGPPAALLISQS